MPVAAISASIVLHEAGMVRNAAGSFTNGGGTVTIGGITVVGANGVQNDATMTISAMRQLLSTVGQPFRFGKQNHQ